MTQKQHLKEILNSARKVAQYPKGSEGYDPVDLINLTHHIKKYDEFMTKEYWDILEEPTEMIFVCTNGAPHLK